ncbi:MAG: ATP-binding protein [bacterium]|nr:ATP-binding protein [bacterium]
MAMITMGVMVISISEKNMVEMKLRSGKTLVSSFRTAIEDDYLFKRRSDEDRYGELTRKFAYNSGASELVVVDYNFNIISGKGVEASGRVDDDENLGKSIKENREIYKIESRRAGWFISQYDALVIYAPLVSNVKVFGGIRVTFPLGELNNLLVRTRWLMLFYLSFALLLFLLFGSYLLSRRIANPLKDIAATSEKIADGDLTQRVDDYGENELGQLSRSFNKMADRVAEHVGYLQRVNRDLRVTKQELIRSEKLASVGRLAAGVAHEIGNPLGAILGYTDMMLKGVGDESVRQDFLERMEKELKKIDFTIRELLDYSRTSKLEVRETDVNKVVSETISLVSHQKEFEKLKLELKLGENLPLVLVDEGQLQQIMMNIVLNAVDAMPDGGKLSVLTETGIAKDDTVKFVRRRRKDDAFHDFSIKSDDIKDKGKEMVQISFVDNGIGIEKDSLDNIFDPFYTTKEPGSGTGLGLSISQRIVETFKGKIEVQSEAGRGTTFTVSLPAFTGEV